MLAVLVVIVFVSLTRADYGCVMDIMSTLSCNDMQSCTERSQLIWDICSFRVTNEYLAEHNHRYYYILSAVSVTFKLYTGGIFPKSEYRFGIEEHNNTDAHNICASEGAHLLHIETSKELIALRKFAQDYWKPTWDCSWTGGYRNLTASEETYYWTTGNEIGQSLWKSGEPSLGPNEACVRLILEEDSSFCLLSDSVCSQQCMYICERDV